MAFTIRSQENAKKVYKQINNLIQENDFPKEEFFRVCKRFPILVKTNGLMQTVAFYFSKAGGEKKKNEKEESRQAKAFRGFLKSLSELLEMDSILERLSSEDYSSEDYMLLTNKALDLGLWYKRYAEILIED